MGKQVEFNPSELLQGRRVAVVGHASSLFGSGYGNEIDEHEVVVRCNLFDPPACRAIDTGSRTDLWYAGWVCDEGSNIEHTKIGNRSGVPICRTSGTTDPERLMMIKLSRQHLNPLRPRKDDISPDTSTSTGIVAVWDCLRCGAKTVDVYGMDCWRSKDYQNPLTEHDAMLALLVPSVQKVIRNDELRFARLQDDGYPVMYDKVLQALVDYIRLENVK